MTEKRPPSSATRKVRECPPRTFPKVRVRGTIPPGRGLIPPSQGLGLGLGLRLGLKFKVRVRVSNPNPNPVKRKTSADIALSFTLKNRVTSS